MSNPDVARMTPAQWLFEYHALQAKEKQTSDLVVEVFKQSGVVARKLLISLLGLDIGPPDENGERVVIPLSMLAGNPEMMAKVHETLQQEQAVAETTTDAEFDALSAKLAKGDVADLDPVLFGDMKPISKDYVHSEEYRQALEALGVRVRDK